MLPLQIDLVPAGVRITWQDGSVSQIDAERLRRGCPCTACASAQRRASEQYRPIVPLQSSTIRDLELIGSSALRVIWADGHGASLYPYSYLRELAPPTGRDTR